MKNLTKKSIYGFDFNEFQKRINKAHKKIISKVHPDISPETARLASIVNEARDTILKNDFS